MGAIPSTAVTGGSAEVTAAQAAVDALEATMGAVAVGVSVTADLAAVVAAEAALALEVGDYTGGGGAEADIAVGLVQAETDVLALEAEVGDYTGGGGAEADVAGGLLQAEADIIALEATSTALAASSVSAQACIEVPLGSFRLSTGAAVDAYSDGVDGLTLQDSKAFSFRLNDTVHTVFATEVGIPNDLDDSAPIVVHALGARIGDADADAALTFEAFFQTVAADYDADLDAGGQTSAFAEATKVVSEETLTIAAINVPAAPCTLSLTMKSHTTLDTDDLIVSRVWLEYTRKPLT
jgi:hypothetical protein